MVIPWKKAELFLSTNNIAHGIEVFLKDEKLTSSVNLQLQSKLNKNLIVIDWKKRNSSFMNALAVEKKCYVCNPYSHNFSRSIQYYFFNDYVSANKKS